MKRSLGTKLYYSIGEVAELTQLQPYTLRAWEKEFSCLRPKRVRGKNRAYREREIAIILLIKRLLYQERYSTRGAQQRLRNEPELVRAAVADLAGLLDEGDRMPARVGEAPAPGAAVDGRNDPTEGALLQAVLTELREIVRLLQ